MARSFPPDVLVLDSDSLLHARLARGKNAPRIVQAKSFRLAADTFATSLVTPELTNDAALADAIRRVRNETGRWDKASVLLPDSWFRLNLIELPNFNERAADANSVVRWSLKRTLPIPPEELRVTYVVLSRTGTAAKLLVVSAMEKTLAKIERVFNDGGIEPVLIEPLGLNVWNAVAVRESGPAKDRLFLYVRANEFTTAVFRGDEPIFIRSRNLAAERSLQQEIRLSASYLRDALRTVSFDNCYVAGNAVGEVAAAIGAEFSSPVRTLALRDFVEEVPSHLTAGYDAELTACTGVFTG
ncbi:MAG: type pilus assembly protein PilM [Gaiellaceae bacterium]|nr:type pilus assembly protein PilM [Gaiellaceae bacterium]